MEKFIRFEIDIIFLDIHCSARKWLLFTLFAQLT